MVANRSTSSTLYLWYLISVATIGPLQFGYHIAELNAPGKVIRCEQDKSPSIGVSSLPSCIPMNSFEFAGIQSIYTLAGLIGALIAGPAATKYGRLLVMRLTTLVFIMGPLAEAFASNIQLMIGGRFLSGIGAGISTVVCPIYISEVSPMDKRGLYGASTQVMTNVGILIAMILGYYLSHDDTWRFILAVAGMFGVIEFLGLIFTPETPKWLSENRRTSKAREVLQKIRGSDAEIDNEMKMWKTEVPSSEEESLLAGHREEARPQPSTSFLNILKSRRHRPAVIGVMVVMVAQQLTGINSIMMYSVSILDGLIPASAGLLAIALAGLNVIATIACAPLADKIGRKPCLLASISGMGASSILLAIGLEYSVKILSAIAALTFVASFAVGLGPVPFILASELVGSEAVGAAQGWALVANWFSTFVVAQFFPIVDEAFGGHGRVFWVFAAMALLLGGFIGWWIPETNGKANADEVWGWHDDRRID